MHLQSYFFAFIENSILSTERSSSTEEDSDSDVDGKPLDEDEYEDKGGEATDVEILEAAKSKFLSSKWETVDPDALEKQAVTTSKWDFFDEEQIQRAAMINNNNSLKSLETYGNDEDSGDSEEGDNDDDDVDGKPMEEEEAECLNVEEKSWMDEVTMSDEEKRKILREIEVISNY